MTDLVDRFADAATRADLATRVAAGELAEIPLTARALADLELIASGAYSPLTGFMGRLDRERVAAEGRLASGAPWSVPITLATRADVTRGAIVALRAPDGTLAGAIEVADVTADADGQLVGGDVVMVAPAAHATPRQLRAAIAQRRWRRTVAFRAGAPLHRGDEHVTKVALETCDGLLVHAAGDVACHEALLAGYYPTGRTLLATLPAAAPRDPLLAAIVARNHGCSHVIVDAGDPTFDRYAEDELGIVPLRFEPTFFCRRCDAAATLRTCPHEPSHHAAPPFRPEVAELVLAAGRAAVS